MQPFGGPEGPPYINRQGRSPTTVGGTFMRPDHAKGGILRIGSIRVFSPRTEHFQRIQGLTLCNPFRVVRVGGVFAPGVALRLPRANNC